MFVFVIVFVFVFVFVIMFFFGQVKSRHHSDQMSQRSQVSRVALSCQKIKGVVCSELVTEVGIELSQTLVWTAKKNLLHSTPVSSLCLIASD